MSYSAHEAVTHQSVYVVRGGYKHVKIGISTNVQRRLAGIQTGCPFPVKLVGQWRTPHARKVEKQAHAALVRYRSSGEWFGLAESVATAVVDTLVKAYPRSNHLPTMRPLPAVVFCGNCNHHRVMQVASPIISPRQTTAFRCTKCDHRDRVHIIDF
jgi:hypothetical protein